MLFEMGTRVRISEIGCDPYSIDHRLAVRGGSAFKVVENVIVVNAGFDGRPAQDSDFLEA